ncbi:MAG: hypothetical protein RLZZ252_522 [Bacteroidota bacterium]
MNGFRKCFSGISIVILCGVTAIISANAIPAHPKYQKIECVKNISDSSTIGQEFSEVSTKGSSQTALKSDSLIFQKIYAEALLRGHSYSLLGELCSMGPRLSGSDNAEKAIQWAVNELKKYSFDRVDTQSVMVPRWERGEKEQAWFYSDVFTQILRGNRLKGSDALEKMVHGVQFPSSPHPEWECESYLEQGLTPSKRYKMPVAALGGSVSGSVRAGLISVRTKRELDSLGKEGKLKGKIVLLARPMEESLLNTFQAYGGCVNQRVNGAVWCAPYGAVAVLVRSVSNRCDMHPHTGVTHYDPNIVKIPIAAVPTSISDILEYLSQKDPALEIALDLFCKTLPDRPSANILAETKGQMSPEKIIAFGGHFDSWDQGDGAHDDGAGCIHAWEALRILKAIGYQPKHTLRAVFWINEENGLRGGEEYARLSKAKNEVHIAALESDRGGFTPRGFGVDSVLMPGVKKYQSMLSEYGVGMLEQGGGGADIGPLKKYWSSIGFVSFIPDSQRYFDVHHAEADVFSSVNKRELELGAAAIAAMIYILDQELD